ncbi:hypothetical protein GCM10028862_18140 [Luteimonas pelagia]
MNVQAVIAAWVGLCMSGTSPGASAQTQLRRALDVSATGTCGAAAYSPDHRLRYRPIGIYNAGDSAVDVACSLRTHDADDYWLYFSFYNGTDLEAEVPCVTLTGSRDAADGVRSVFRSVSIDAGRTTEASHRLFPGQSEFLSLSCRVPHGVEMGTIHFRRYCEQGCD